MSDTVPEPTKGHAPAPTAEDAPAEAEPLVEADHDPAADHDPEADHDPAAPAPLNIPRTPTGNAEVDAGLERLGDADHLTTDGHIEVYEDVHRGLRDTLTALDARPGPPAPPPSYR
ncbi:hypothetical protein [Streptomyces spinosisporus]|jgi:hypothetical protein|uniref:Uncharacterized protein n=1 Tax=Streptomyces spinosisporus TaxID=2927582 RepID=A0ABS9XNA1_9ACTN|nr:hypothetical protein [Streptomyces spinosisporus]MCI3243553.1 hypothetical protein [Streptomyces spinosisporus]